MKTPSQYKVTDVMKISQQQVTFVASDISVVSLHLAQYTFNYMYN